MIEDEDSAADREGSKGTLLLYDYFKHLTSLCVITLGGVLALAEKVPSTGRSRELLVGALVVIGLAALSAFGGASEIVRARTAPEPSSPNSKFYLAATPLLLSVGLGMFTWLFARSLF